MKLLLLLCSLLLLTGCVGRSTYLTVKPHDSSTGQTAASDAVMAQNYQELKRAILGFVERGQTQGAIHVSNYDGNVEEDLTKATYEVVKLDPLGAYAVDYMNHDCTLIVSYYEIRIDITFRRSLREIEAVESVATQLQLVERLQKAVENYEPRLALRISGYREQDVASAILKYCREHPDTIMEVPEVSVSVYPDRGSVRIVEIELHYRHEKEELEEMEVAVRESVDAAAEYIRYRETDLAKAELLYTNLLERFSYVSQDTTTPVYDALCRGVADPVGLATAWKMVCDRAGMECYLVTGLKDGEEYTWNILNVDGVYRHLDLAACMLLHEPLQMLTDGEMAGYYWNQMRYPACEPLPEPAEEPAEPVPQEPAEPGEPEPPVSPENPEETEPPAEEEPPAEPAPQEPDTPEQP